MTKRKAKAGPKAKQQPAGEAQDEKPKPSYSTDGNEVEVWKTQAWDSR